MKQQAFFLLVVSFFSGLLLVSCSGEDHETMPPDKELTVSEAKTMISNYTNDTLSAKPVFLTDANQPVAAFNISSGTLDKISELKGYTGIRLYLATKDTIEGRPIYTLVVVPRGEKTDDGNYKNILKDGYIFDWIPSCPEVCPDEETELPGSGGNGR